MTVTQELLVRRGSFDAAPCESAVLDDLDDRHGGDMSTEARRVVRAAEVDEARRLLAARPCMPPGRKARWLRAWPGLQ